MPGTLSLVIQLLHRNFDCGQPALQRLAVGHRLLQNDVEGDLAVFACGPGVRPRWSLATPASDFSKQQRPRSARRWPQYGHVAVESNVELMCPSSGARTSWRNATHRNELRRRSHRNRAAGYRHIPVKQLGPVIEVDDQS